MYAPFHNRIMLRESDWQQKPIAPRLTRPVFHNRIMLRETTWPPQPNVLLALFHNRIMRRETAWPLCSELLDAVFHNRIMRRETSWPMVSGSVSQACTYALSQPHNAQGKTLTENRCHAFNGIVVKTAASKIHHNTRYITWLHTQTSLQANQQLLSKFGQYQASLLAYT